MKPFVSVIIPEFDDDSGLIRCLNSIDRQSYVNTEVIVAGRSCPSSLAGARAVKIVEGQNREQALNRAVAEAAGKYVLFCSATSVLSYRLIETLINESEKKGDFVSAPVMSFDEENDVAGDGMRVFIWGYLFSVDVIRREKIGFIEKHPFSDVLFLMSYMRASHRSCTTAGGADEAIIEYDKSVLSVYPDSVSADHIEHLLKYAGSISGNFGADYVIGVFLHLEGEISVESLFECAVFSAKNLMEARKLNYSLAGYCVRRYYESLVQLRDERMYEKLRMYLRNFEVQKDYITVILKSVGIGPTQYKVMRRSDLTSYLDHAARVVEGSVISKSEQIAVLKEKLRLQQKQMAELERRAADMSENIRREEERKKTAAQARRSDVQAEKTDVKTENSLAGPALGEFVEECYLDGKLGLRTAAKSVLAWSKYKLRRKKINDDNQKKVTEIPNEEILKKEHEYKISVIIPMYNQEDNIERCIASLRKQTIDPSALEIIIINDGSTDGSDEICRSLVQQYDSIVYINQENTGVSGARNAGIRAATGKYLFYLDADDELDSNTIEKVTCFFDSVYDDVDLVTYRIDTSYDGRKLKPHFRYRYLKESGIYDLNDMPYIGQTTMNIVVKNKFQNNVYFDTSQTFSEDQKYCCEILSSKLKIGFCSEGRYIYYRSAQSSSGKLAGACIIFEQCMDMFERMFAPYDEVPAAFQGLYVNDLYWKMLENILLPYHYGKEEFEYAMDRICRLLEKCDERVILDHPNINFFEKYYFLSLKRNHRITCRITPESFELYCKDKMVVKQESMEIIVTRLYYENNTFRFEGFLKSVFLNFYDSDPVLCAVANEGELVRRLRLKRSMHSYYLMHEMTQRFLAFSYECHIDDVQKLHFEVEMGDYWFPTHFYFMPLVPLDHSKKNDMCRINGMELKLERNSRFLLRSLQEEKTACAVTDSRKSEKSGEIWLYYDCSGVGLDNGLLQFQHDIKKNDGIERYYVLTDSKQVKYVHAVCGKYVRFGTDRHKELLKRCSKVLTSFIEEPNIIPYDRNDYKAFARNFHAEVIYLQHGVLHIVMPWKYTREKLLANRVVVSTEEEARLYAQNGYGGRFLIKTGMPRFALLSKAPSKKKILFAPSWRKYLVGEYVERKWQPLDGRFIASRFYQEINLLVSSPRLKKLFKRTGWRMEIKLHPIFNMYREYFDVDDRYISFVDEKVNDGDYDLFITDFSSYAFNFSYLNIPVMHFIPDVDEFKCGMNGYRQLNYPESFWDMVASDHTSAIDKIADFCAGKTLEEPQVHFYKCSNIRENIYREVVREAKRK